MNLYLISGLILDCFGVILLCFDLIKFQNAIRKRAKRRRALFDEMESDYGGIESWANEIMEQSKWIPSSSYSRHHADDEVSYNAQHAMDRLRDISSAVNGLAAHLVKVTEILRNNADQNRDFASSSFRVSICGLACLMIGFVLQFIGALNVQ